MPAPEAKSDEREVPAELGEALVRMGLAPPGARLLGAPLPGGVSSDIWRIELESGPVCIKRALPRLKVEAEWRAPVERNSYEVAWMRTAAAIVPDAVPPVLGEDVPSRAFAMSCLDPSSHRLWKSELMAGRVDPAIAAAVGGVIGRIHAATAGRDDVARSFPTDACFHAIRLQPYLLAAAARHADVAPALESLADVTARERRVLVHGDVSPKNILAGPDGPVLLDAECAWFGDPAFDLAFCLNHLLLKSVVLPGARDALGQAFDSLCGAYFDVVDFEPPAALEARAARLLPGLALARVDGKSPVEYLHRAPARALVRDTAKTLLRHPPARLGEVRSAWVRALAS